MWRHDVILEKLKWDFVVKEAELYQLKLPKNLSKLKKGKSETWERKGEKVSYWRNNEFKLELLEVTKVFQNVRDTIKVILAGADYGAMIPRHASGIGWLGLELQGETWDLYSNIKEGSWLVTSVPWRGDTSGRLTVLFLANETLDDVKKMLAAIHHMWTLKEKYDDFTWNLHEIKIPTWSTVTLSEVMQKLMFFDERLRNFRWYHRKKMWDKSNAEKKFLSFKKTDSKLLVTVDALDGFNYKVDADLFKDEDNYSSERILKKPYWSNFCWRDPEENKDFFNLPKMDKEKAMIGDFLVMLRNIPSDKMILTRGKRQVIVEYKKSNSGSKLSYLDGKLIADLEVFHKISEYFLKGIPVVASSTQAIQSQQLQNQSSQNTQANGRKSFAEKLQEDGLNGEIRDLEGNFPFHLNILYKEEERRWYIEVAGTEYHVPGGITSLKKIKSAIEGTAILANEEAGLSYDRHATSIVRQRLAKLIGEKESLKVVIQVKQMGAMVNAINSK